MMGIYKITNPKGKIYIGQSVNINRRWWEYKKLKKKTIGVKLYNSLKRYGVENHQFEIIEECSIEQLNEREIYWTLKNNALHPYGLVLQIGDAHGYMSEETKQKMRKPKHTKESKAKISQNNKGRIRSEKFKKHISELKKGIIFSEEQRQKISKAKKGKPKHESFKNKLKRPILQYDLEDNLIKEWPGIKDAASSLNISQCSVSYCCQNKIPHTRGIKFKYKCLDY